MFTVQGMTHEEEDVELDRFEDAFMRAIERVMRETARQVTDVVVAAAEPGEPFVTMDSLRVIATLWAREVAGELAQVNEDSGFTGLAGLIELLREIFFRSVDAVRESLREGLRTRKLAVPPVRPPADPDDDGLDFELEDEDSDNIGDDTGLFFGLPDEVAIEYLRGAENRMVKFSDELWALAREQLTQGFAEGESIPELRDRLMSVVGLSAKRATVVARTESHQAAEAASLAMVQYSGFTGTKTWEDTKDDRTRETHRAAAGQTVGLEEFFEVGGASLLFPGDPTGPPEETIQCVPGNTLVQSIGKIQRVYRRWYQGIMVTVNTTSGIEFSATPNHPVLTSAGWKRIQDIHMSDKLVRTVLTQRMGCGDPQIGDTPTEIAEVYRTSAESGIQHRIAGRSVDFHGDGTTGEVEVITVDSRLSSPCREENSDLVFFTPDNRHVSFFDFGGFECGSRTSGGEISMRGGVDTRCGIGRACKCASTIEIGSRHPFIHGSATPSGLNTDIQQSSADDLSRNAIRTGQELLRLATEIPLHHDDIGDNGSASSATFRPRTGVDPRFSEPGPSSRSTASNFARYLRDGESVSVQLEHVRDVVFSAFDGHVFNLETESGTYIGNGITHANCRCTQLFQLDDDPIVASAQGGYHMPVEWEAVIIVEDVPTGSGMSFSLDALELEVPGPLQWMERMAPEHQGAVIVGNILEMERRGNVIIGRGTLDAEGEHGAEALRLIRGKFLRGVSADVDDIARSEIEYVFEEGPDGEPWPEPDNVIYHGGRIRGATLCAIPAYVEGAIRLIEPEGEMLDEEMPDRMDEDAVAMYATGGVITADRAPILIGESGPETLVPHRAQTRIPSSEPTLTAASSAVHVLTIPDVHPAWWYDEPTDVQMHGALTVTDEGRIYGYLAPANVAHRSFSQRVTVPMGNVDYSNFLGKETFVDGGGRVVCGALTMDCGHASLDVAGHVALDHYDNACSIVASVNIGERPGKGVWVGGGLMPGVTASQVSRMLMCQLSGDWRPHKEMNGWREFAGALLVPVPGFAMARKRASVRMVDGALVSSAVPVRYEQTAACGCVSESTPNTSPDESATEGLTASAVADGPAPVAEPVQGDLEGTDTGVDTDTPNAAPAMESTLAADVEPEMGIESSPESAETTELQDSPDSIAESDEASNGAEDATDPAPYDPTQIDLSGVAQLIAATIGRDTHNRVRELRTLVHSTEV